MIIRSRSVRAAGLALALAMPLVAANAAPAFADGDDAVVSTVITDGNVHVESTKGLSRVTIVLCDGDPVVVPGWTAGQLSGDVEVDVDDVVQAVFIHSGNNTTPEAQALLALLAGDDAVSGNSTGAIAFYDEDACDEPGDDDGDDDGDDGDDDDGDDDGDDDDGGDDGDDDGGDDGDELTVTPSDPAPVTSVLPLTVVKADTPAPTNTVLGETLVAGAELPRTGAGQVPALLTLALSLIAAGTVLRAASSRRVGSASFPG